MSEYPIIPDLAWLPGVEPGASPRGLDVLGFEVAAFMHECAERLREIATTSRWLKTRPPTSNRPSNSVTR